MWNLCVLGILLAVTCKGIRKFHGEVFLLYLLLYGMGRAWIEGLRTDQLLLPVVNLPVSQLLSVALVLISAVLLVTMRRRVKNGENRENA